MRDRGFQAHQQITEEDDNGHLSDGGDEDGRLVADFVGEVLAGYKLVSFGKPSKLKGRKERKKTNLLTGEVNANSTLPQQASIKLILITRNTGDNNITKRRNILKSGTLHLMNLMTLLLQPLTTGKLLHTGDINAINASTVISQQCRQRPTHDLGPVNHANRVAEESVAVGQDGVVDVQVFQDLDDGEGRAGKHAFLALGFLV